MMDALLKILREPPDPTWILLGLLLVAVAGEWLGHGAEFRTAVLNALFVSMQVKPGQGFQERNHPSS